MQDLKAEIAALEATEPPQDFTSDQIGLWLESLKNAPDQKAVRLLVERIDIKTKTEFHVTSTLNSVLRSLRAKLKSTARFGKSSTSNSLTLFKGYSLRMAPDFMRIPRRSSLTNILKAIHPMVRSSSLPPIPIARSKALARHY